jgi:hypothetical protein
VASVAWVAMGCNGLLGSGCLRYPRGCEGEVGTCMKEESSEYGLPTSYHVATYAHLGRMPEGNRNGHM